MRFREAVLGDVVDFLNQESRRLDPQKTGVNIISMIPPDVVQQIKLTIDLRNIPLLDALRYIAELNYFKLRVDDHAIVLYYPLSSAPDKPVGR